MSQRRVHFARVVEVKRHVEIACESLKAQFHSDDACRKYRRPAGGPNVSIRTRRSCEPEFVVLGVDNLTSCCESVIRRIEKTILFLQQLSTLPLLPVFGVRLPQGFLKARFRPHTQHPGVAMKGNCRRQ